MVEAFTGKAAQMLQKMHKEGKSGDELRLDENEVIYNLCELSYYQGYQPFIKYFKKSHHH